jgi:hypothetical protein
MNNIEKEFVPYEEALALEELGFYEPCIAFYNFSNYYGKFLDFKIQGGDYCSPYLSTEAPSVLISTENKGDCPNAPTFSQAFRWFREKHNLIGGIECIGGLKPETTWWDIYVLGHFNTNTSKMTMKYQPYEEAELACLKKLIEIAKQGGNR